MNDTKSETIFETLYDVLQSNELDASKIRGHCYDGEANVSGNQTGLQTRVQEISASALFVHCYAHILNLVIVDTMTSKATARDFLGTMQNLYVFIQTCTKRHAIYTEQQAKIHNTVILQSLFKFAH